MKQLLDLMNKKSDMQITPLIDIVFLLLVFFMVSSTLVKKEADLAFALPLPPTTDSQLDAYSVELLIEISELGNISIEGMVFESQMDLIEQLLFIKASADASSSQLVVSILPDDKARHGAIVPVMDACAAADVKNMTFSTAM